MIERADVSDVVCKSLIQELSTKNRYRIFLLRLELWSRHLFSRNLSLDSSLSRQSLVITIDFLNPIPSEVANRAIDLLFSLSPSDVRFFLVLSLGRRDG